LEYENQKIDKRISTFRSEFHDEIKAMKDEISGKLQIKIFREEFTPQLKILKEVCQGKSIEC